MNQTSTKKLCIGLSARALFDLEAENCVYEKDGIGAYRAYQREREGALLDPGPGYPMISALLRLGRARKAEEALNEAPVEAVVMSRNSPDLGLRIVRSIEARGLEIQQSVFAGGASLADYFKAFGIDLFLSRSERDVQQAVDAGIAGAVLYPRPADFAANKGEVRIAFDADAVLFSDQSEALFKQSGLRAFNDNEAHRADIPLGDGPFAHVLRSLSYLRDTAPVDGGRIRLALVTSRSNQASQRVIRTLQAWNVHLDAAFFLSGMDKRAVLEAYRPHIFFDDQRIHTRPAARIIPTGRVPYLSTSPLHAVEVDPAAA